MSSAVLWESIENISYLLNLENFSMPISSDSRMPTSTNMFIPLDAVQFDFVRDLARDVAVISDTGALLIMTNFKTVVEFY